MEGVNFEYKGYEIRFAEGTDKWFAYIDGSPVENEKLSKLKESINRVVKGDKSFDRFPVILKEWSGMIEAEVTSVIEEEGKPGIREVWVSYKKRGKVSRGKVNARDLRIYSAESLKAAQEYRDIQEQREELSAKADKIITNKDFMLDIEKEVALARARKKGGETK